MQVAPHRRRQPVPQRARGYGRPAPVLAPAPPPPPTYVHTVMLPRAAATHHASPAGHGYPAATYMTMATLAGPAMMPVTMAPHLAGAPNPMAGGAQPGVFPMGRGGQPGMPHRSPYGPGGPARRGPPEVPGVHYRRVIARRR